MKDKISEAQLGRAAYVYIRQSTLQQVRHNRESNRRQYALQDRARELGFREVVVIDDDLGISGTGNRERPGFSRLLSAVCNGEVGAVVAFEASRLARNNRDWHHLIDLCVLTRTIVIDAEGIYDPRLLNDRLLLGLKGTMSEFEIGILRQRAQEAYRQKVLRGEVLTRVPVGYTRREPNGIEITPDREVQEAIRTVFQRFEQMGSLRQVLLWYHHERILFPALGIRDGICSTDWRLPDYQQLLRVLKNPTYAGAFAYGRTQARFDVVEGRSRKSAGHKVSLSEWQVLIKDHHAGYITWEQYMANQCTLTSNRTKTHAVACGAARNGSALLSGLLRCAQCGQKLHVAYRGRDGTAPRYYCMTGSREQGKPSCLCFGALKVERAVVDLVLAACEPIGVEASLEALNANSAEQLQKTRLLELALERARYAVDRARRQYDAVDPGNRLVAAELESRWNAALTNFAESEERLKRELQAFTKITAEEQASLAQLGSDLKAAWHDAAAPIELKKRILRTVLNEIVVDVNRESNLIEMKLHWAGGTHSTLTLRKNKAGRNGRATDLDVVELVRELAKAKSDQHIAANLNRLGHQTGTGNNWTETRVKNLRQSHDIAVYSKGCERTWMTMSEAARDLKVSMSVIRTMINRGLLSARQVAKHAPWMIKRADIGRGDVQTCAKAVHAGKRVPRMESAQNQLL